MKKLLTLLFVLTTMILAQTPQVNIPLILTDNAGGKDTLRFGLDPTATNGIDLGLGEAELPPMPPSGVFDIRFVGDDITIPELGQGVKKDYRTGSNSSKDSVFHELKYQVGNGTQIVVKWNLPAGVTGVISDLLGGVVYNKIMTGNDSLVNTMPGVITKLKMKIVYNLTPAGTINLTAPNGGENWVVGASQNITWTSTNVTNVKIEYSTNNGTNYTVVAASVPATPATYAWTIPNTPSTQCLVKVSDAANATTNDVSNAVFTISAAPVPAITVIAPNGGENWQVGSSQNITWTSANVTNVKIEYSTNNGTSYSVVAASVPATPATYAWTVPNTVTTQAKVKITDLASTTNDESNAVFTISAVPVPGITVTAPNGGENWQVGTSQNITWTSSNVTNVKIEYTTNNGTNWIQITATTPSTGNHAWTVGNTPTTQAKVKITDLASTINDESNAVFTISAPPPAGTITILSPKVGDEFKQNANQLVVWKSSGVTGNVKITLSTNSGVSYPNVIAASVSNNGYYAWNSGTYNSTTCKIKIESVTNTAVFDTSKGNFGISGTLSIFNDNPFVITDGASSVAMRFGIDPLATNGIDPTLGESELPPAPPSGVFDGRWVDTTGNTNLGQGVAKDYRNGTSTFTGSKIHSVKYQVGAGDSVRLYWSLPTNVTGNIKDLLGGILVNVNISGTGTYTVPNAILTQLRVQFNYTGTVTPTITVTAPNGGENWIVGTTQNITWTQTSVTTVKLEYSTNNGTNWTVIGTAPALTFLKQRKDKLNKFNVNQQLSPLGTYAWTVPNTVSTQCLVKVSDNSNALITDVSNSVFTISPALPSNWTMQPTTTPQDLFSVSIVDPNVAWIGGDLGAILKTTNGGTTWINCPSIPAADYVNNVKALSASTCLVAIIDAAGSKIVKTTDGGNSWTTAFDQPGGYIDAITMFDANNGYAVGDPVGSANWTLLKTTNGGSTWTSASTLVPETGIYSYENAMSWVGNTGYFGTNKNKIYKSTDIGTTWTSVPAPILNTYGLNFGSANNGMIGGDSAKAHLTTNGGTVWNSQVTGGTGNVLGISVLDNNNIFLASGTKVFNTTNGGTNWAENYSSAANYYHMDMKTVSTYTYGYIVGDSGYVAKYAKGTLPVPAITVTAPNGGENWQVGSSQNITWTSANVANVKIEYTTDNGTNWIQITASTPSTGSEAWTVGNTPTTQAKVRITDLASSTTDMSNNTFTIVATTPATVKVLYPNGGQYLTNNSSQIFAWKSTNLSGNVNLYLSTNGGTSYTSLAANVANNGYHAFNMLVPSGALNKFKVESVSNPATFASSDSNFTILGPIAILKDIPILISDGNYTQQLRTGIDPTATDSIDILLGEFELPPVPPSGVFDARLVGTDISVPQLGQGVIRDFRQGTTVFSGIKIHELKFQGGPVLKSEATSFDIFWNLPTNVVGRLQDLITGTQIDVAMSGAGMTTVSNIYSKLKVTYTYTGAKSITVNSPNGGENWQVATIQNITWSSTNVSNVKIEYTTNNGTAWTQITASVPAIPATYAWTVPNTPSAQCKVKISEVSGTVSDESNATFTITTLPVPAVTVTAPNGGENWLIGSSQNITWTSANITNVKIEYTTNNGTNWIQIAASVPVTPATYAWTVPNTPTAQAKVKITDVASTTSDESNAVFTISLPSFVNLISPSGAEVFKLASSQLIAWQTMNVAGNVNIKLSTDGGTTYPTTIAGNIPNSGLYAWTTPTTASSTVRIKVESVTNPAVFDISETNFAIQGANIVFKAIPFVIYDGTEDSEMNFGIDPTATDGIDALLGEQELPPAPPSGIFDGRFTGEDISIPAMGQGSLKDYRQGSSTFSGNKIYEIKYQRATASDSVRFYWNLPIGVTGLLQDFITGTVVNYNMAGLGSYTLSNNALAKLKITLTYTSAIPPLVNIITVRPNNAQGVPIDSGLFRTVKGTVTMANEINSPSYFQDSTAGVALFSRGYISPQLKIGDVIQITARLTHYRGLIQFDSVMTWAKLDSNKPVLPKLLTIPQIIGQAWNGTELYEGSLVRLNNVRIVGASGNFVGNTNYNIVVGTDTTQMRATTGTTLVGKPIPTGLFDVIGALGQFVSVAPYRGGYQVLCRFAEDVIAAQSTLQIVAPVGGENWIIGSTQQINWTSANVSKVKMEYTTNNGTTWTLIGYAATSPYNWVIPATPTTQAKVRVSDSTNATLNSVSANVFTIKYPPLGAFNLVSPANNAIVDVKENELGLIILKWNSSATAAFYKFTFGSPTLTNAILGFQSVDTSVSSSQGNLYQIFKAMGVGNQISGQWAAWSYNLAGTDSLRSISAYNITFKLIPALSVDDKTKPTKYELAQNYPNPFNPSTKIKYQVPNDGMVNIMVYNMVGEKVMTLVNEEKKAGYYEMTFDAKQLNSGIYLYKMVSGSYTSTKKMILIK